MSTKSSENGGKKPTSKGTSVRPNKRSRDSEVLEISDNENTEVLVDSRTVDKVGLLAYNIQSGVLKTLDKNMAANDKRAEVVKEKRAYIEAQAQLQKQTHDDEILRIKAKLEADLQVEKAKEGTEKQRQVSLGLEKEILMLKLQLQKGGPVGGGGGPAAGMMFGGGYGAPNGQMFVQQG